MSITPIATALQGFDGSIIETSSFIILNGIKYQTENLSLQLPNVSCRNCSIVSQQFPVVAAGEKSQVALSGIYQGGGNVPYWSSTVMFQPNFFAYPELKSALFLQKLDVVPIWNSGSVLLFDKQTGDCIQSPLFYNTQNAWVYSFIDLGNSLYLLNTWSNCSNGLSTSQLCFLYQYNSSTNTFSNIHGSLWNNCNTRAGQYLGKSPDGSKFFMTFQGQQGDMNVGYYLLSNHQVVTIQDNGSAWGGSGYCVIPSQIIPDTLSSNQRMFYYVQPTGQNSLNIVLVTVDVSQETVSYQNCTLDTTTNHGFSFYVNGWNDSNNQVICTIVHKFNNNYYVTFFQTTFQTNLTKMWTFKVLTDSSGNYQYDNLQFVYQSDDMPFYSYIVLDSSFNNLLILSANLTTAVFNGIWNFYNTGISSPIAVIYDSSGRIFCEASSNPNNIYLLLPSVPISITYDFEKQSYQYSGSPINTYVNISAYNYLGKLISVTGTLQILSNNATFSNNQTKQTVTTSSSGPTTVNLTITGPGVVEMVFDVNI